MKKLITMGLIALSLSCFAQDKGVTFESGTLKQILQKAKANHQFVFIDCYATWCVPCRHMDDDVYPDKAAGDFVSSYFISVKLQLDTTKKDKEDIKERYLDAAAIKKKYAVNVLPTFLFLSSNGQLIYRDAGFKTVQMFIAMSEKALRQGKLLKAYDIGTLAFDRQPELIMGLKNKGNRELAEQIAGHFIDHLLQLPHEQLFIDSNLIVLGTYTNHQSDSGYQLFLKRGAEADAAAGKGFSNRLINKVVVNDEVNPYLWMGEKSSKPVEQTPDWQAMNDRIDKRFGGQYSERNILNAQISYAGAKHNWPDLIKANVEKIDKYGLDTAGVFAQVGLNNMIYSVIFKYCNDATVLNKAIGWMKVFSETYPTEDYLDTYANLLYKAHRTAQALEVEEKAVKLSKGKDADINKNFEDMKLGKPTWPTNQ